MRLVMKKALFLFSILTFFCSFLFSCSSDPTSDDSILIIEPDTLVLAQTDSSKVLDLKLSCGCGFMVQVTNASGDTNMIKYVPIGPLDEKLSKHSLRFTYSPASTAAGPHSVKLDFLATKKTYTYTNSVIVRTP
jgi:hypothetical protein